MTRQNRITGAAIHRARARKGWSQRELARRIGVCASTVSTWERGTGRRRSVPIDDVMRLIEELGLRLSDFGVEL